MRRSFCGLNTLASLNLNHPYVNKSLPLSAIQICDATGIFQYLVLGTRNLVFLCQIFFTVWLPAFIACLVTWEAGWRTGSGELLYKLCPLSPCRIAQQKTLLIIKAQVQAQQRVCLSHATKLHLKSRNQTHQEKILPSCALDMVIANREHFSKTQGLDQFIIVSLLCSRENMADQPFWIQLMLSKMSTYPRLGKVMA